MNAGEDLRWTIGSDGIGEHARKGGVLFTRNEGSQTGWTPLYWKLSHMIAIRHDVGFTQHCRATHQVQNSAVGDCAVRGNVGGKTDEVLECYSALTNAYDHPV